MEYFYTHIEREEHYVEYDQSHIKWLWILIFMFSHCPRMHFKGRIINKLMTTREGNIFLKSYIHNKKTL